MAVVIASDLGKDIAGEPLLRGVSFKLERRDRMTLSGATARARRRCCGCSPARPRSTSASSCSPRASGSRCTTSARRASAGCRCATTCSRARASWSRSRPSSRALEQAMADGAHDEATLDRYAERPGAARARRRLPLARAGAVDAARPRLPRRGRPRPPAADVLRRRADARLAGAGAGRRSRPAAARRAHQPPRHRVARVARAAPGRARRRRSCWSPTTAGSWRRSGRRCSSSRPGAGSFFAGPWHAWRREKAARELALGRAIERQQAEIERLERFVTRFRAGTRARQAQSRAKQLDKIERIARDPADGAALEFAFKPPERSGRVVFELERRARDRRATRRCSTTPSCGSSAASTSRWWAPTAPARRR